MVLIPDDIIYEIYTYIYKLSEILKEIIISIKNYKILLLALKKDYYSLINESICLTAIKENEYSILKKLIAMEYPLTYECAIESIKQGNLDLLKYIISKNVL